MHELGCASKGTDGPVSVSLLWSLGALEDPNRECTGYVVWIHTVAAKSTTRRILHVGLVTPRPTFYTCAPPISRALTVARAANKPNRDVDTAAENSPSLQLPDMRVPICGKTQWVLFSCGGRSLWHVESMKQVRALLLNKITTHDPTPSAIASEF